MEFPLDAQSRALPLNDGDIVRVLSIVPRFNNAVTLRGNVVNPGRYPWKPGMRVRDLIPNAQALLTRPYWMGRAGMTDGRSTEYPIRPEPKQRASQSQRLHCLPMPPPTSSSGSPRSGDQAQSERCSSELARKNPNSETLTGDLHRASPEINWSYAIIQRVNPVDLSTKLLSFDLGKAVLEGDAANNLELQPDDIITIFSQSDVAVPQSMRARYVRLEGEVVRAGVYKAEEGELLRDVIKRAGGVTPAGLHLWHRVDPGIGADGAAEEHRRAGEYTGSGGAPGSRLPPPSAALPRGRAMVAAQQSRRRQLVERLKNLKATGRVVIEPEADGQLD